MTLQTIEPSGAQLRIFADATAADAPIIMLNLLRYRAQANYSDHPHEPPCSGRDAFKRYARLSIVCIEASGGKVLFMGNAAASVIGPIDEQWDDIFLVQYPSRAAFLQMIATPEYRAINFHRSAALQDSRLIPVQAKLNNL
jgi:uncharacterized protein (DUF1330 family)